MKSSGAVRVLAELSASQWGMVTTAQAAEHGVQRLDLSRLANAGHLERLARGVYRDAGAPSDEYASLRAAWLAAEPSHTAEHRLRDLLDGVVVMGESAASLHGVGDLPANRHEFSSPVRRQTQRPEISYRQRQLERGDVTIARGLPVTTIERTIADLVEARTDLSLVADVLSGGARRRRLDNDRLAALLGPLAARNGLHKDDGPALLDRLITLAGLDTISVAAQIATSETLSALVAANSLARLNTPELSEMLIGLGMDEALQGLNESIAQAMAQAISPALEHLAASIEMPPLPGLQAALAELAKQVSLSLPTQELLGSFGEAWAASLASATATDRGDVLRAFDRATAAEVAGLAGSRG